MLDNDSEKQKTVIGQNKQLSNQDSQYLHSLPQANPIKKRQKLQTASIFPILPLPKFSYVSQVPEPTNSSVSSLEEMKQKLILPSNSLASIFQHPIYVFNQRALRKNNSDFGCIKVKYAQSMIHKKLKDQPLIWDRQCERNNQEFSQKQIHQKELKLDQKISNNQIDNRMEKYDKSEEIPNQQQKKNIESEKNSHKTSMNGIKSGQIKDTEQKDKLRSLQQKNQQKNQQLHFQSRFESGNLCFVSKYQKQPNTYFLLLNRDFNTSKCTQWFFFRARNNISGKATFHIVNFVKNYSVFSNGMKICYAAKSNSFRWARGCEDIKYRKTNLPIYLNSNAKNHNKNGNSQIPMGSNIRCYYSLSFSYNFQKPEDQVYFAYCYPYTYSMLENFMWKSDQNSPYFKRRNIATTPGNNSVDMVTITNFKQKQYKKRVVFIMARVHPGQTPSSFVCEGMMKYLIGETTEAIALRDNFIFKFIPMLNPDGVINGSYRCSLSGYDLNRVWHIADKISHPEIYAARKNIFEINEKQGIFLTVDLHAHSKKKGIFMYGSQNRNNPYLCRQIPFLLWKNIPQFNYYQCNFAMRMGRQGTSRLYLYQQLGLHYSYTMEHSFCGPSKQKLHFTSKDYNNFGVNFLFTLNRYFYILRKKNNMDEENEQLKELYTNKQLIKIGDNEDGDSSSDQELDSSPLKHKPTHSEQKKLIAKRQIFRLSDNSIKTNKISGKNLEKKNKIQISTNSFRQPTIVKFMHTNRFGETVRPIPIVGPGEKQLDNEVQSPQKRQKVCYSSLGSSGSKNLSTEKKAILRETFRYDEQEEINSLTNLFLPSLTSASYKKYSRKAPNSRNMVHIGKNLIQNAIIIKQQIKSSRKKKMTWKQHARSYL